MLLENNNAIIYGGGGSIGRAVAKEFAREGAKAFLAGRTREKLEAVAEDIEAAGRSAEVAVLDALDENAVEEHAQEMASRAGSVDISFNLVTRGDGQQIPLVEMELADFIRPITTGITTNIITARAAARQIIEQGSGVILALDSGSAHGSPMMGGTGPADAATDAFVRNLATEVGPRGVRVVGIWTTGLPETLSREKMAPYVGGELDEATYRGILENLDEIRMTRRSPTLAQLSATAAFLASEKAGPSPARSLTSPAGRSLSKRRSV
jgi:NAD(P)-dependent dehydrogenase (short-subunit alcohol dehydrogenase family)